LHALVGSEALGVLARALAWVSWAASDDATATDEQDKRRDDGERAV